MPLVSPYEVFNEQITNSKLPSLSGSNVEFMRLILSSTGGEKLEYFKVLLLLNGEKNRSGYRLCRGNTGHEQVSYEGG